MQYVGDEALNVRLQMMKKMMMKKKMRMMMIKSEHTAGCNSKKHPSLHWRPGLTVNSLPWLLL